MAPQDHSISVASLTIDDTRSETAEFPSRTSITPPLRLLDLPNETLLAIVARIPFSSEAILNLELVNRQLRDLLTSESNLQDLRNQIAKIQYPLANALRHEAKTDVGWEDLDILQHDTSETLQLIEWMRQYQPSPTFRFDTLLLEIGIHLLLAIQRIGISLDSEQGSAELLLGLKPALVAMMRVVSTTIVACLRNHPEFHGYVRWQDFLSNSSAIPVIEGFLVTKGVADFLTIDSPQVLSNKALFAEMGNQSALAVERLGHLSNFFMFYSAFTCTSEEEKAQYMEFMNMLPGPRAGWSDVVNDILILDSWTHEGPSRTGIQSEEYRRAFHSFCTDRDEVLNRDMWAEDDSDRLFMQMSADLMVVDWYAFVSRMLPIMLDRAYEALSSDEGLLEAVCESFRSALENRRKIAAKPGKADLSKMPPHFAFLMLKKAAGGLMEG